MQKIRVATFDPLIEKLSTAKTVKQILNTCNVLIIATAHTMFTKKLIPLLKNSRVKIIIDGRNCLPKKKILSYGIAYKGIGH